MSLTLADGKHVSDCFERPTEAENFVSRRLEGEELPHISNGRGEEMSAEQDVSALLAGWR